MNNLLNNVKVARVLAAVAAGQATSYSDILDMKGFQGVVFIAKLGDVAAGSVLTLAAQQNSANSETGMATLEGSVTHTATSTDADDNLLILDVVRPNERYVRAALTSATADAAKSGILAIQYGAKEVPITQGSTVLDSDTINCPDEAA